MSKFIQMVGERIRSIRKLKGMTQEQLAERSGLSFSYISDVERGTRNISLGSLEKIIGALNVKPVQIFEDMDKVALEIRDDATHSKLEDLNILLREREANDIEYVIKVAHEFINTIDRKKK